MAGDYERSRQWFAAAFHLSRLILAKTQDGRHYLRRGKALAGQGKAAEAKQDFDKALTLKASLSEEGRLELENLRREAEQNLREPPGDPANPARPPP